jgi:hypothetical protein
VPRATKVDLERWAVDQALRSQTEAAVAVAVGNAYAYPGVNIPWDYFKEKAGTGGSSGDGRSVSWGASGIKAAQQDVEVTISWRRAAGIALRDGLILRALADAYPHLHFVFARNMEVKEWAAAERRRLNKENKDLDISQVQIWEDPDGQVQCRDGRRTHQGRPGGRREVPVVRE